MPGALANTTRALHLLLCKKGHPGILRLNDHFTSHLLEDKAVKRHLIRNNLLTLERQLGHRATAKSRRF